MRKISGVVGIATLALTMILTVFCATILLTAPAVAQESAEFALRGTIIETLTTFEGDERALIHANQFAYWVTCDSGSGGCAADLIDATGQCADVWGDALGDFTIPPASHEYYEGQLVVAPSDCSTERSLFLFIGHVTSSVSPSLSSTGNTEFEVAVNSEIFHVVCPSGSGASACAAAVSQALLFGRCVAVGGNTTTVLLGLSLFGDFFALNQATAITVFNRTDC